MFSDRGVAAPTQPELCGPSQPGPGPDSTLMLLHNCFQSFNEVLNLETVGSAWDASKTRLQELQAHWQASGLCGEAALRLLEQYRPLIQWDTMVPDVFSRFYRFVFHLCREPNRRNMQTGTALTAWSLLLTGRFRLLDRWCTFVSDSAKGVITEDTWRQVLDFRRTIHEDLSNYDPMGAWAVMLDDFVEDLRASGRASRQATSKADDATSCSEMATTQTIMGAMSPRCGSKRRGPDVDRVAEQLSAMPALDAGERTYTGLTPKRMCTLANGGERQFAVAGAALLAGVSPTTSMAASGSQQPQQQQQQQQESSSGVYYTAGGDPDSCVTSGMTSSTGTSYRRSHLKIKRSGVTVFGALVQQSVTDALGFS